MAQLDRGVQRDLIAREVDGAKINWGHVAIAQLMAAGYVDRVLTTLAIKRDFPDALSIWGAALADQAQTKVGEDADRLFAEAGEKNQAALALKPDKHEVFNNWGHRSIAPVCAQRGRGTATNCRYGSGEAE
jgi:hypothetical protein